MYNKEYIEKLHAEHFTAATGFTHHRRHVPLPCTSVLWHFWRETLRWRDPEYITREFRLQKGWNSKQLYKTAVIISTVIFHHKFKVKNIESMYVQLVHHICFIYSKYIWINTKMTQMSLTQKWCLKTHLISQQWTSVYSTYFRQPNKERESRYRLLCWLGSLLATEK